MNGLPDRLDLRDEHVRLAIEAGVQICVNTDAHSVRGLGNMRLAVATARRGGATVGGRAEHEAARAGAGPPQALRITARRRRLGRAAYAD